ncbi:putative U3 small nucleolar RNA-associated protein 22 [Lyophyllum shimeji]|uniref:U3 small nucleolar RNA-associated protein 22 n=1 Tax=Lyophyllum shimeji TaxID=47721 RepID=A0A9P3USH2_LYOSH|nr:putative U3 small nucleolar RNA-associated protein 22 [Lyophyllum shimeji]
MALNLKRKRGKEDGPRKARKVDDELIEQEDDILGSGPDDDELSNQLDDGNASGMETDGEEEADRGEWNGVEDQAIGGDHQPGTKPKKPPTGEELRVIKDATDLFRSSSFKLQIDALLPNVRPKASRLPPLERFLLALHTFLMGLPSVAPRHPLEASRRLLKKGVSVPYSAPLPTEETNWKVAFEKPSDITVVGSWPNKISVKAKDGVRFGVDVAVEMPDSLFQEKDYLNGRFFHKRAFYLATIASAISSSKSGLNVEVQYDSLSYDPRLAKLVLTPRKDDSPTDFTKLNAQVNIIPVLSSQCPISIHRLSPSHSNLRIQSGTNDESEAIKEPTPMYNTALLSALTPKTQLLATHALKEDSPAFSDALTLLRVWANQRGYGPGARICVRGFESRGVWWSALLGLLIAGEERAGATKAPKRKPLGRGLSSYQLFRAALDFLSKHDFQKDPVFLKTKEGVHRFSPEDYQQHHGIVFVDSSSTVNLLAGVPLGSLELLRHDALKTLEALDHASISADPFADVFLTDHRDLPTSFDTVLRVDLSSAKPLNPSVHSALDFGSPADAVMASLSSLLHHGLGDRTKAIAILHTPPSSRPLSQAHPSNPSVIYIGLIHNPSTAYRLVDHGPAADEEDASKAQQFRDFWGDKAELRRFKDGRIIESVVWDVKTADERAHVPGMIVRHVLQRHFGISNDAVQTWQTSYDSVLRLPEAISSLYLSSGITTGFKGALTAFDNLVRQIKSLDDALPLAVLNISPVSEQLRYTNVFTPVPLPRSLASTMPATARYLAPINLIVEFEKSSRWPDDLKAIQKTKLAFFERIATELMAKNDGLRASVVVGDGVHTSEILDQSSLEIVTAEGWAFSLRIWNDREAVLLDRIIDEHNKSVPPALRQQKKAEDKDGKKGKVYREALEAKEVYTRRFIHAPRHHRAIAALCHQYSAFAGVVRLVKRWLASHWLLHGHITEEAVELICAAFFVGDGRHVGLDADDSKRDERASVPGSKERGFAAVIAFLKEWRWEEGLFIPLYGVSRPGEEAVPKAVPKTASGGVWNISTDFDKEGRMWTARGPDAIVAHRVRALAKATWEHLQGMESGNFNVQAMFIHPTTDYDFIVRLDPAMLPRCFQNVAVDPELLTRRGKYANLLEDDQTVRPGFDPAHLLFCDLQRIYGHTFKIFHDTFGGDRFGVVWDPSLKEPRPFRVLGEFSSVPVKKEHEKTKDKGLVVLNEASILSEIERLGSSLVKEIIVHV